MTKSLKKIILFASLSILLSSIAYAFVYQTGTQSLTLTIRNIPNYYVNQLSNVDSSADKGTHSNFTAQQYGPDSNYDTLTESNTGGLGSVTIDSVTTYAADSSSFSFSHSCSGSDLLLIVSVHCDNGIDVSAVTYAGQSLTLVSQLVHSNGKPKVEVWRLISPPVGSNTVAVTLSGGNSDKVTIGAISYNGVNQTTPIDGVTSAQGYSTSASVTVTSETGDLVQDTMAATSAGASSVGSGQTQRYNREMGGSGVSNHFGAASTEAGASSVTMSWSLTESKEWVIIGFNINPISPNYELDLEIQWTNVDFNEANEELCIYGGLMASESLRVDAWNGTAWQNVIASLTNGWNNVTVSAYLVSSTFTIRFKGSLETTDATQDSWAIDATLLHLWL